MMRPRSFQRRRPSTRQVVMFLRGMCVILSLSALFLSLSAVSLSHTHAHSCGVASSNSCASCVVRRVLCVRSDNEVGAGILNISLTIFAPTTGTPTQRMSRCVCVVCSEEFACSARFHGRNPKCGGCRRMRPVVIAGMALALCEPARVYGNRSRTSRDLTRCSVV